MAGAEKGSQGDPVMGKGSMFFSDSDSEKNVTESTCDKGERKKIGALKKMNKMHINRCNTGYELRCMWGGYHNSLTVLPTKSMFSRAGDGGTHKKKVIQDAIVETYQECCHPHSFQVQKEVQPKQLKVVTRSCVLSEQEYQAEEDTIISTGDKPSYYVQLCTL